MDSYKCFSCFLFCSIDSKTSRIWAPVWCGWGHAFSCSESSWNGPFQGHPMRLYRQTDVLANAPSINIGTRVSIKIQILRYFRHKIHNVKRKPFVALSLFVSFQRVTGILFTAVTALRWQLAYSFLDGQITRRDRTVDARSTIRTRRQVASQTSISQ